MPKRRRPESASEIKGRLAKQLKELREARGFKQKEIASRLGFETGQAIHSKEKGVADFSLQEFAQLTDILGFDATTFLKGGGIADTTMRVYVPLLKLDDREGLTVLARGQSPASDEHVRTEYAHSNLVAVRVIDGSVDAELPIGSIAIFDLRDKSLVDGKFYLIAVNGVGRIRRYRQAAEGYPMPYFEAASLAEKHRILPYNDTIIQVIGRLAQSTRNH